MATIITLEVDGISDKFEVPSISFGLNSSADVSNTTQEIDFSPINVSEFSFSIVSPLAETAEKLMIWITDHEIKGSAKFSISKESGKESPRVIELKDVCLTSYSENIDSDYASTNLSLVGREVNIGNGVKINQSKNR
ncbi:hypothetical protein [Sediminicola luteus]|uniref:Phage tail protein n=1 Tax=Sediminicola luteus TaxID=319238 RepID=A0ABV2U1A4_9FLAO